MELSFSAEQLAIRDTARGYAREVLAPEADARDRMETFPTEAYADMGRLGLLGLNVPRAWGGSAAGTVALALALEEVAAVCPSTAVGMSVTNMVGETIHRFGTEAQKARFLPGLTSGDAVAGAFCLSETGAGSDAGALRTTARPDGDGWVLDGTKMWITSGAHAGVLIVLARSGDAGTRGISAFLVTPDMRGFSVSKPEDKVGLRGSNTVQVILEGCRVPSDALLSDEGRGFGIAMTALDGGRITIGAMANGISRAALEGAARYALAQRRGGRAIASEQGVQHQLADMATGLDASRLMVMRAAWLKERAADGGRRFTREAAMAKLMATENARALTQQAVHLMGWRGNLGEGGVARAMRDARVTAIFEGTTEIQKIVIARQVLDQARV